MSTLPTDGAPARHEHGTLALHAVTSHAVEHYLPAPFDIHLPTDRTDHSGAAVLISLGAEDLDAWLASVVVLPETETVAPVAAMSGIRGSDWERCTVDGLLGAHSIRVRLTAARPSRGLRAVGA